MCLELLAALKPVASNSTYMLFEALSRMPPLERVTRAIAYALECAAGDPDTGSNVVATALDYNEYTSYCELMKLTLPPTARITAERLLCVEERGATLLFLRTVLTTYASQPRLADMDPIP